MVDTNSLLSFGFSVVASFAHILGIPQESVPTKEDDLRKYAIGAPAGVAGVAATDLYMVDRRGSRFWIRHGAVQVFSCSGSYKENDDPARLAELGGAASLNSTQALKIAEETLRRLTKDSSRSAVPKPTIRAPGRPGDLIPFFWVSWPTTNLAGQRDFAAFIEIDARSGVVTCLELRDERFYDPALDQQISAAVYFPDPEPQAAVPSKGRRRRPAPLRRLDPYPTTNEVQRGIASWLSLCQKLGVDPGPQTNVDSVYWEGTSLYTNAQVSMAAPVCQVQFNNGACFESISGVAFSHYGADACFSSIWEDTNLQERERFRGKAVWRWKDLARSLEGTLVGRLGVPKQLLSPFTPELEEGKLEPGEEGTKRVVVAWRNWPKHSDQFVSIDETVRALAAEFDVETGELKWINLNNPHLVGALRLTQAKQNDR